MVFVSGYWDRELERELRSLGALGFCPKALRSCYAPGRHRSGDDGPYFMIKYIGSKRLLVPHIVRAMSAFPESERVLDLFSGTSRVACGLKQTGRHVIANDHLAYAATLARCYVQADADRWLDEATQLIAELSSVAPAPGYFTKAFCEDARYFQPKNGARVDAIREEITRRALPPELEAIALVSLMEAADRVDSTTGVQMAYLKAWAPRALNELQLRMPDSARRRRAASHASMRPSAPGSPAPSTWPTWIRPTTSTATWATTTSGRAWFAGTSPKPTASPTSASSARNTRATSTPSAASAKGYRRLSRPSVASTCWSPSTTRGTSTGTR